MISHLCCGTYREFIKTHVRLSSIFLSIALFYLLNNALKCPRFIFSTPVTAAQRLSQESHSSAALSVSENFTSRLGCVAA